MSCEWEDFIWGDLATLEYGKSLRNYKNSTGKYPVFGTNGQIGYCDKPLVNEEGVIIGRKGAYRGVHYSKDPFFVIDTAFYLKPLDSNSLDIKFAYYQLLTLDINSLDSGSAIPSTSREDFYSLPIKLPSINEQHEIVNLLKSFDDKIEFNRQMNTTLEQMAQAIFKHWFIDFEFPDENGKPYRSSGGEMVDSELGEIPVGWEVKQIGNVCKIVGGGTPKTKEPSYWEEGDIFWATPTDMTSLKSPIIFDTSRKITNKGLENSSAKLLPINSILMTSRVTLGYFAINKVPICTNQGFISMIRYEDISKYYLLNAVRNKMGMIESLAGGSTYPEISKTVFKSIKIIVPLLRVMQKYETFCDFLYEKIYSNDLENINLSEFRDTLLPKLMSGKIRVKQ